MAILLVYVVDTYVGAAVRTGYTGLNIFLIGPAPNVAMRPPRAAGPNLWRALTSTSTAVMLLFLLALTVIPGGTVVGYQ
jgi:hypothetical protein